ncbi:MAG TPA: hypothetical protein PLL76_23925 [Thermoanaerobaculia bacterium]|nr:hypothetical protein [Thermoanaerobaculia bacterium]HQP89313.1 hypothetical protein [Thermoanaerobaculia bacterium]
MSDAPAELARQAAWQKARRDLPWPEKVRMVLVMRESIAALRRTWPSAPGSTPTGRDQADRGETTK